VSKLGQLDRSDLVGIKALVVRKALFVLVLNEVKLDRVEADNLETRAAFLTGYVVALLALGIHKNFFTAFRTN
jgi:hypothetical protein